MVKSKILISFAMALFLVSYVSAVDYYIDYETGIDTNDGLSTSTPWKHCPGMVGFYGIYIHSAGDKFIFKGGVIWNSSALPLTIAYSGENLNYDEYTVDQTWYDGISWANPVFDGGGSVTDYIGLIFLSGRAYVKIDSIKIQNVGISGVTSHGRAILLANPDNIEISNCIIASYSNHGIVASHDGSVARSNLLIHHNDISHCTNSIEIGAGSGEDFINVFIYNNAFHDPHSQMVDADHADGIHIFSTTDTQLFKNVKIYNNKYYGDWGSADNLSGCTAQLYLEDGVDGAEIYNNVFSFENPSTLFPNYAISPGFIALYGSDNIKVYSNTMVADAISETGSVGVLSGITLTNTHNVDIRNNIFSKMRIGIIVGAGLNNITSDYNQFYPRSGDGYVGVNNATWRQTLLDWQIDGYDFNGVEGNPEFIDVLSPPFNLHLQQTSPAIDAGTDLSAYFTTDFDGVTRPQGPAWDIGAYEYIQTTQTCTDAGGTCHTNTCDTYTDCVDLTGTCVSGYCCSGTCSTSSTCGPADSDSDGVVSILEVMNYITEWKAGNVNIVDLMAGITEWKSGC